MQWHSTVIYTFPEVKVPACVIVHTWAQGGSCLGYPPPEKFWVEIPPHREGYSLAKYSPPSEKFFPHPKNSPPKIWKKWQFLWIPPLNFVNFLGSPPWRRWLFGSLDSPPKKFSKSLPPDGLRCSPMYGMNLTQKPDSEWIKKFELQAWTQWSRRSKCCSGFGPLTSFSFVVYKSVLPTLTTVLLFCKMTISLP